MAKKGQNITSLLGETKIKFSTSHCKNLTNLYKLCSEHPKLLKCGVSIRTILGNMKLVKDICSDLKWQDKISLHRCEITLLTAKALSLQIFIY